MSVILEINLKIYNIAEMYMYVYVLLYTYARINTLQDKLINFSRIEQKLSFLILMFSYIL